MSTTESFAVLSRKQKRLTILGILFAFFLICCERFLFSDMLDYLANYVPVNMAINLIIFTFILTLIVLIIWGWLLWFSAARKSGRGPAGLFSLCLFILIFLQLASTISICLQATDLRNIYIAYRQEDDATITEAEPGHLIIEGPIGPNLMADITKFQEKAPITQISITSNGGLLDQAWMLAELIKEQDIAVIVNNYCISACVHIAVAAHRSYADENAYFGIHRPAPIVAITSEITHYSLQETEGESRSFLRKNGVSEAILEKAAHYGGDDFLEVSPHEMLESGAITGIMRDDIIITEKPKKNEPTASPHQEELNATKLKP